MSEPSRVEAEASVTGKPRLSVVRKKAQAEQKAAMAATTVGSLPARIDLLLYQGDDFILDLIFSGPVGIDMATYTAKAEIRQSPGSAQLITTFVPSTPNASTVRLHLTHSSAELLGGDCSWDCQITDTVGTVTTVAYGSITLTKQVTR